MSTTKVELSDAEVMKMTKQEAEIKVETLKKEMKELEKQKQELERDLKSEKNQERRTAIEARKKDLEKRGLLNTRNSEKIINKHLRGIAKATDAVLKESIKAGTTIDNKIARAKEAGARVNHVVNARAAMAVARLEAKR